MLTCGIFYCRDSAEIEVCGSLQTLLRFESDMLRNRQQKHTADRYAQVTLKTITSMQNDSLPYRLMKR